MITTGKFDAFGYIKQHKGICYCEAILYPDGTIEDAIPSHLERLITISEIPRDELWERIKVWESPLEWLCNYTGCISIWYHKYYATKPPTKAQLNTLKALSDNKVIVFEEECKFEYY